MAFIFRTRVFRILVSYSVAVSSLLSVGYGISLIADSLNRNASSEGSALIFGFGLVLLILSAAIFIIWFFHWRVQLQTPAQNRND